MCNEEVIDELRPFGAAESLLVVLPNNQSGKEKRAAGCFGSCSRET